MTKKQQRFEEIKDQLRTIDEDIILFDGYEDALVGCAHHFTSDGSLTVRLTTTTSV